MSTHNFFILAIPGATMADNTVNVGINVTDNGTTAGITRNVEHLRDVLDQAAVSAARVNTRASATPVAAAGSATTGRIIAASTTPGMSAGEGRDYGTSRAVGGGTGAGARDFAKESVGLGGVVRLYATFAANIYAVSTAFEALNKASAADRMIKSSEMLSISMGANLKSIAKNLQEVTDYSLSMQEATQFTNMGISAGLAGKQIENLTKIAKGAASALGRDTGESIRRIITGTAKQEQEILDELGIFIKAKDAYKEYAKKFDIKGGADSLTAQQKVVAYADAVEKAGEKWKDFAEIPDPFSKFKAKGSEALQELLTNINKLIIPIISFLSESSDRIKAILVVVGIMLTRRALPELKNIFTNLFTFDAAKAKAEGDLARYTAVKSYADITAALEIKQAERAAMLAKPMGKPELASTVATAAGGLAATRGIPGGIDVTKLTSAIAAKDLALYESRAQIENKVLTTLEAQVKVSQNKSIVVQKLIDQGLISNKSTETNLILGREGLSIAEKTFASIDANNIQLKAQALIDAELVGLGKQQLVQREQLVALGKAGGTIPLGPVSGSTTAAVGAGAAAGAAATAAAAGATTVHTAATDVNTAAIAANNGMRAANIVATEAGIVVNAAAITSLSAFNAALAQSAAAHARLATTMGLGLRASFVVFGQVLAATAVSMWSFNASMGFGARAAHVFGSAVVMATEAVAILGKLLSRFFGWIMIAYTAWELFGDKIKSIIGINTELSAKQEELEKQTKTYNETLAVAGAATDLLNEKRSKGLNTLEDIIAAHRVELTSITDVLNAFTAAEDKKKEVIKQKQIDLAREEAVRNKQVFDETAYYLKKSAENIELTEAEKNSYLDLAKKHQDLANSKTKDMQDERISIVETAKARTNLATIEDATRRKLGSSGNSAIVSIQPEVIKAQDELNKAIEKENALKYENIDIVKRLTIATIEFLGLRNKVNQQQSAADAAAQAAAAEYEKGFDKIQDRRKELLDPTTKIRDVKVEETINNFKKLFEYTGSAIALAAQRKKIEEELQKTVEKTIGQTKVHAAAQATLIAYQKAVNSGQTNFKEILKDILPFLDIFAKKVDDSVRAPVFRPYTDAALAGFIELKSKVDASETSIKRANMELSDVTRIDSRTKAIQGYSNAEQLASMNTIRNKIAEEEQTKAETAAQLEFDKIANKKDKDQAPKAREQELTAATKALAVAKDTAKLTKEQADANNKTIKQDNEINVVLGLIQKKYEAIDRVMAESNARSNAALDLDKARLDALSQLNAYSERGLAIRTRAMEQDRIDNSYAQALAQATKDRSKAQEDLNARIDNDVKLAGTRTTEEKRIEEIYQNKITLAGTANNLAKDTLKISTDTKLNQAEQNELVEEQNFALGRLDVLKARELITNDEYIARKRVLELSNIQQRSDRERNITLEAYNKDLEGLQGQLAGAMEFNQPTEGTQDAIKAVLADRDARLTSMQRIKDAKVEQAEWDAKQNERQVGYTEVFKSSFNSMGDAIMEFAKTGKLNFKSLINDMIAGLVKLELKMAMSRMMEGMGGFGGIASKAISFFTGVPTPGAISASDVPMAPNAPFPSALGSVYDSPIKTFAMGGAFSNSIVSSPTLFKFASGAGLMGEAGPEAIMPLKRDPQGNLGVRGGSNGGGNVEVVVNNFGSEKATTKETTDSKGNRKIEVVIGDLSAGEITRSGSSSQRAIRSTFGMQPQLIRR